MRTALTAAAIAIIPALAFAQVPATRSTTTATETPGVSSSTRATTTTAPAVPPSTAADGSAAATKSTSTTVQIDRKSATDVMKKSTKVRTTTQPY